MTWAGWIFAICMISAMALAIGGVWYWFMVRKPKVRVNFSVKSQVQKGRQFEPYISLFATNNSPNTVTLHAAVGLIRDGSYIEAYFSPLHDFPSRWDYSIGPFSGGLPATIEAGGSFRSCLGTLDHEGLRDNNIVKVGFLDTDGTYHWAPREQVEMVVKRVRDFRQAA